MTRPHTQTYYPGRKCDGCRSCNWLIGRLMAECARCGAAAGRMAA
jgi:hypothetical protein